jgi:hypothetical protein
VPPFPFCVGGGRRHTGRFPSRKRNITACRDKKCALHDKEMRAGFPEKCNRTTPMRSKNRWFMRVARRIMRCPGGISKGLAWLHSASDCF